MGPQKNEQDKNNTNPTGTLQKYVKKDDRPSNHEFKLPYKLIPMVVSTPVYFSIYSDFIPRARRSHTPPEPMSLQLPEFARNLTISTTSRGFQLSSSPPRAGPSQSRRSRSPPRAGPSRFRRSPSPQLNGPSWLRRSPSLPQARPPGSWRYLSPPASPPRAVPSQPRQHLSTPASPPRAGPSQSWRNRSPPRAGPSRSRRSRSPPRAKAPYSWRNPSPPWAGPSKPRRSLSPSPPLKSRDRPGPPHKVPRLRSPNTGEVGPSRRQEWSSSQHPQITDPAGPSQQQRRTAVDRFPQQPIEFRHSRNSPFCVFSVQSPSPDAPAAHEPDSGPTS